jgi:hypothetical protein
LRAFRPVPRRNDNILQPGGIGGGWRWRRAGLRNAQPRRQQGERRGEKQPVRYSIVQQHVSLPVLACVFRDFFPGAADIRLPSVDRHRRNRPVT